MAKNRFERNYDKLQKIVPQIFENNIDWVKLKADGYMDLNVEYLYTATGNRPVISLAHYYKLNGDSMRDPEMIIRADHELKTVEALTFQQDGPPFPIYQEVYPDENHVIPKLKQELNAFLDMWLKNIIDQGHEPYMINGEEIQQDISNEPDLALPEQDNNMDMNM